MGVLGMGPKKGQKKTEEATLAAEDPAAIEISKTLAKWTERASANSKKIQQAQNVLSLLAAQMEGCNKELADVFETANLLAGLHMAEYRQKLNPRPQSPQAKKQRSKRENSTKLAPLVTTEEDSTEALLAAMDEKKRLKVTNTLVNFFRRNATDSPGPNLPGISVVSQGRGSFTALTETAGRQEQRQQQSAASSIPTDRTSISLPTEQRKPKDVPPEMWEEMAKLRFRRMALEGRAVAIMKNIESQLERFDLLMRNHRVATCAAEDLEQALQQIRLAKSSP